MIRRSRRTLGLIFLLVINLNCFAQQFGWKSILDTVSQNGFYSILLTLDWNTYVKPELSDIRINDQHNRQVPFLVDQHRVPRGKSFINFPILKNSTDTSVTILELDARGQRGTDHLSLIIGNNAVERTASLSGSNDRQQWFIIDERLELTREAVSSDDNFLQWLQFPFIRYQYLKLMINNRGSDPLPILKAGVYTDTSVNENIELYLHPGTVYEQKDSVDGNTYVWLHNQKPFPVDRISVTLSGSKFYRRTAEVYSSVHGERSILLGKTEFRSGEEPTIWLQPMKAQDLLVVIRNIDNPPLKVSSIRTESRKHYLIAYLEKGKQYTLFGGSEDAISPHYDLDFFKDSIPAELPIISHTAVVRNEKATSSAVANWDWWIWPAIVAMLLILGILTYKLVGDERRQSSEKSTN